MSFFDDLLLSPDGSKRPCVPLWRLKLTDEEYKDLQGLLRGRADSPARAKNDVFRGLERECTLMYAEYWRREYEGGPHDQQKVYESFAGTCNQRHFDDFRKAAHRGARQLGVKIFHTEDTQRRVDSMLYQGGLPLRLICDENSTGAWQKFTKKMLRGCIDLDDPQLGLGLGRTAQGLEGVRQFACELRRGAQQPAHLPFYCGDARTDRRYLALKRLWKQEKRRQREQKPFVLEWYVIVDPRRKRFGFQVGFEGPQKLSSEFIDQNHLDLSKEITVEMSVGEQTVATFSYINGYCRNKVGKVTGYRETGQEAVILLNGQEIAKDKLSVDEPMLFALDVLFKKKSGERYRLCKRIGTEESLLCVPQGWNLSGDDALNKMNFSNTYPDSNCQDLLLVFIPHDFDGTIEANASESNKVKFSKEQPLYWTEFSPSLRPIYNPMVLTPALYDLSSAGPTDFTLCHDEFNPDGQEEDTVRVFETGVEFRSSSRKAQWGSEAPLGKIRVRSLAEDNQNSHVKEEIIVNIGSTLLNIRTLQCSANTCVLTVAWDEGTATCIEEGATPTERGWRIQKEKLQCTDRVRFRLTPRMLPDNSFVITLRVPFKEVVITHSDGTPVKPGEAIALCDFETYRYRIAGSTVRVSFSNINYRLSEKENRLFRRANHPALTEYIPLSGSLVHLLGSRARVEAALNRQAASVVGAELPVKLEWADAYHQISQEETGETSGSGDGGRGFDFILKDYPLRLQLEDNSRLRVTDLNGTPVGYPHQLLCQRLHFPQDEVKEMISDDQDASLFYLPHEWRLEPDILVFARTPGYVLPKAANPDVSRTFGNALKNYLEGYKKGEGWNEAMDWFVVCCQFGIPASSVWQLCALGGDAVCLMEFARRWADRPESTDEAAQRQLLRFSEELDFKWFWLINQYKSFSALLGGLKFQQFMEGLIELSLTDNTQVPLDRELVNDFVESMRTGKPGPNTDQAIELNIEHTEFNQKQQDEVDGPTHYFQGFYRPYLRGANEQWIYSRAKVFALGMPIGQDGRSKLPEDKTLFELDAPVRRSLCFCYEQYPNRFLYQAYHLRLHPND